MNGTFAFLAVLAFIGWAVLKYGPAVTGVGHLPPGYTLRLFSPYDGGGYNFEKLQVILGDRVIFTSGYTEYGYRTEARKCSRAAWAHYHMTKVEDAR